MSKTETDIYVGDDALSRVPEFIFDDYYSKIFVLADENTFRYCYPLLEKHLPPHHLVKIKPGEKNKTIKTCELIWQKLTKEDADRNSLLINLGGGVVGDIGGFVAGCYKRGIKFINVPTTLLAMVDASVGGKTGIDFQNYKNQIGLFNDPSAVFIYTGFLKTLPDRDRNAGMMEVVKHYAIADADALDDLFNLATAILRKETTWNEVDWNALVIKNINIKSSFTDEDKYDEGKRKALNFGHTAGHALETHFLSKGKNVLHGEAVGAGLICEGAMSFNHNPEFALILLPVSMILFDALPYLHYKSIPAVIKLMKQDKKNRNGEIQFSLLNGLGSYSIEQTVNEKEIVRCLTYYSEMTRPHKV